MTITRRKPVAAIVLLVLTALLWILVALFKLRVTPFFHAILIKRIGMIPVLGFMLVAPVIALMIGFRFRQRVESRRTGLWMMAVSGFFVSMFLVFIGYPILLKSLEVSTPANPRTPRPVPEQIGLPVFPGAQGFGTRTPAGRGGRVIEVTSLADSGPGSLRDALEQHGPRIVVFRTGGTIELQGPLFISNPFLTVAGQSAPGGGICLKNAGLVILTHDVLIQHLRIRPGVEGDITPEDNDAVAILGKHGQVEGAAHVVLDHLSASWGEDETVSVWYGAHDITISHCLISEALNKARHAKQTHSAGLLIGDGSYHVSTHHCLLAHNDFRNPLIASGGTHDLVNNVIYNWGVLPAEIVDPDANTFLNFTGNHFRPGPSSRTDCFEILINPKQKYGAEKPKLFVRDNLSPHRLNSAAGDWSLVGYGFSDREPAAEDFRAVDPFPVHPVAAMSAAEAWEYVLGDAGATRPQRDAVDQRVVAEARGGSGRIIDAPSDVGGYPDLAIGTPVTDTDRDGMPDDWETASNLNPHDSSDGNLDRDNDGYTNVEEFLQTLLTAGD
jgi:hypothetical protein